METQDLDRIRFVTHYDVSPADIDTVISAISQLKST